MRVLVTGAAGFIGSHLCARLSGLGHNVLGIDNFSDYYSLVLKHDRLNHFTRLSPFDFEEIDITNRADLHHSIQKFSPELVVHLAAQPGVRLTIQEYDRYIDSNLLGFGNVIKATLENQVPSFLYASSSSVYGDNATIPYIESEDGLKPISFYGATKLSNEIMAKSISSNVKTKIRGLRFFTVYGPWGRPDMAYFKIANALLNNEHFTMYGDGSILRDFTFIDDTVTSIGKLINQIHLATEEVNDVVNVGGGKPHSLFEMIETLESLTGKKLKLTVSDKVEGDVKKTISDTKLQLELTGFIPEISLEQGLSLFLRWLTNHPGRT
jgi:UDP-glucuronate 4-epimerase